MPGNDANTKLLLHANGGDGVKSAFAHVKCNDNAASTTVTDDGTGANTFTASTNTDNLNVPGGKINAAFDFNGTTEYITADALDDDITGDTIGSFSVWAYVDTTMPASGSIFSIGHSTADTYLAIKLEANGTDGSCQVRLLNASAVEWSIDTAASSFLVDTWYHFVVVQDGVDVELFIDGVSFGVSGDAGGSKWLSDITTNNGRIGCLNYNSGGNVQFFPGQIDDLRYFKCALSQTEVDTLYASGSGTENSIITDSSLTGPLHTAVQTFADAQLDTAKKKWSTASLLFDGTGDYVTIPDSADWDLAGDTTSNQTFDMQVNHSALAGTQYLYSQREDGTNSLRLGAHPTVGFVVIYDAGSSETMTFNTAGLLTTPGTNTWYHVAVIKVGGDWSVYYNGNQVGFGWTVVEDTFSAPLLLGQLGNGSAYLTGNMDEFRVQADNYFTAAPNSFPAASLLLYGEGTDEDTTMSNDGYSGAVTMVGGAKLDDAGPPKFNATTSMFFNGTSDYLSVVDTSGTDYDIVGSITDSWTMDFWVKHTDHAGFEEYVSQRQDATHYWQFYHSGGIVFQYRLATVNITTPAGAEITDTNWHHVAFIKSGPHLGLYLDGVQSSYLLLTGGEANSGTLQIATWSGGSFYYAGYMEQFQITKGNKFGRVPTPDPHAWFKLNDDLANTVVVDDGSGSNNGTLTGGNNTEDITTAGKTGTCLTYDGSADYVAANGVASSYVSDTTGSVACWFNLDDLPASNSYMLWSFDPVAFTDARYLYARVDGSGNIVVMLNAGATLATRWRATLDNVTVVPGNWYHLVVVQDGVSPKIYVNGVNEPWTDGVYSGHTLWLAQSITDGNTFDTFSIGALGVSGWSFPQYLKGKVDDLRYYSSTVLNDGQAYSIYIGDT